MSIENPNQVPPVEKVEQPVQIENIENKEIPKERISKLISIFKEFQLRAWRDRIMVQKAEKIGNYEFYIDQFGSINVINTNLKKDVNSKLPILNIRAFSETKTVNVEELITKKNAKPISRESKSLEVKYGAQDDQVELLNFYEFHDDINVVREEYEIADNSILEKLEELAKMLESIPEVKTVKTVTTQQFLESF